MSTLPPQYRLLAKNDDFGFRFCIIRFADAQSSVRYSGPQYIILVISTLFWSSVHYSLFWSSVCFSGHQYIILVISTLFWSSVHYSALILLFLFFLSVVPLKVVNGHCSLRRRFFQSGGCSVLCALKHTS